MITRVNTKKIILKYRENENGTLRKDQTQKTAVLEKMSNKDVRHKEYKQTAKILSYQRSL